MGGKQRPGEGEPVTRKKFTALFPIIIAFVFSAGVGYFVVGPFAVTQTMGNPGMAARAHGDNFHHKAAFMPMQLSRQAVQPSHRVSEFPARMSTVDMAGRYYRASKIPRTKSNQDMVGRYHGSKIPITKSNRDQELGFSPFSMYVKSRRADARAELKKTFEQVSGRMFMDKMKEEWAALSREQQKPFYDKADAIATKAYLRKYNRRQGKWCQRQIHSSSMLEVEQDG